jgi:hypothetical protein
MSLSNRAQVKHIDETKTSKTKGAEVLASARYAVLAGECRRCYRYQVQVSTTGIKHRRPWDLMVWRATG